MGSRQEDPSRLEQIDRVIEEVIRQRRNSVPVDDTAVQQAHAELMPELAERLRTLQMVEAAARNARQAPTGEASEAGGTPGHREDLDFLRAGLEDYELLERFHHGGQGVVYRALQKSTNRIVAIKVLLRGPLATERQRQRFAREVELVSRLRHPHIVTVHGSGVVRGCPYFSMEYIDGLPIDDYALVHNLPVRRTVELFSVVCRAVSAAHQHGILHRDLKPSNILVDADGQPHILDFGLAKELIADAEAGAVSAVSLPGQVVGTLPYLSPEQAGGQDGAVDVRSDIYSLGVVLYQLLSGAFPYPIAGDRRAVQRNILTQQPRRLRRAPSGGDPTGRCPLRGLDDDLETVVLKTLEKEKGRRYQSADALANDLARWLSGHPVEAKADRRLYLVKKTVRRYRVQAVVAGAFVVLLIGALAGMTMLWKRSERIARVAQAGMQMGGLLRRGEAELDAGRIGLAKDLWENVLRIGEDVDTPDPQVLHIRLSALVHLGEVHRGAGEHDAANHYYRTALGLARQVDPAATGKLEYLRYQALLHAYRARMSKGSLAEAVHHFDNALAVQERVIRLDPNNPRYEFLLAKLHGARGDTLQDHRRFEDALRDHQAALRIHLRLHTKEPLAVNYRIEVCRLQARLGVWHTHQQTPQDDRAAWQWFQRARAGLRRLQASEQGAEVVRATKVLIAGVDQNLSILRRRAERWTHPDMGLGWW